MDTVARAVAALIGSRWSPPPALLDRFPELRRARYRRGGLPLLAGGWALGRRRVAGITLWRTIFVSSERSASPELLLHELRHVHQFETCSFFPLHYLWETLRVGYRQNRFEVDAREWARAMTSPPVDGSPSQDT
ncbi:MAG: hypothetical protein ACRENI_11870 [Gemmatimonadaceae bacterium]